MIGRSERNHGEFTGDEFLGIGWIGQPISFILGPKPKRLPVPRRWVALNTTRRVRQLKPMLALCPVIAIVSAAHAQPESLLCHLDRFGLVLPAEGEARDVVVDGDLVYVAEGSAGLRVFDLNSAQPSVPVGHLPLSGGFNHIVKSGGILLVGTDTVGLRRIRISDPTTPASIGWVSLSLPVRDVAVEGGTSFVANMQAGLKIINTPQTGTMSVISTYTPSGGESVTRVSVRGGLAAVGHAGGVDFVDVSDLASPQWISSAPGLTSTASLALGDGVAYLSSPEIGGVMVLDLSDAAAPSVVRTLAVGDGPLNLEGGRLYLSDALPGTVQVFDLADPSDPQLLGSAFVARSLDFGGIAVGQGIGLVAEGGLGTAVVSLEPLLDSPVAVPSGLGLPSFDAESQVTASADGAYGYYMRHSSVTSVARFFVVDLSVPHGAPAVGAINLPHPDMGNRDIRAGDGFVYLAGVNQPIVAVDVRDPSNPVVAGSTATFYNPKRLVYQNGFLYGTPAGSGLQVFDVRDPGEPAFVSTVNWPPNGQVTSLSAIGEDLLAVGRSWQGIQIVDTSNAPSFSVVGSIGGFPQDASASDGDTVYTLYYSNNHQSGAVLRAIDVSDPTTPVEVGQYSWPPATLWVGGGTLSMAGPGLVAVGLEPGRVSLLDVSDPADIRELTTLPSPLFEFSEAGPDRFLVQSRGLTVYSTAACEACPADLNGDGLVNFFDLSAYIGAFNAQDASADLAEPFGMFNFFDVAAYLSLYGAGCP